MYDSHYDLLTILYFNFKRNNKLANKEKCTYDCKKIYKQGNVDGGIINLYFMSLDEMKEELGITKEECENVRKMFKKSIFLLQQLQENSIITKDKKFIYSIEGCDFVKSPDELYDLYNMGLRSILPVWNNQNKYGSGNRSQAGLSYMGKELVDLAIKLGIAIDVSHANRQTFSGIMDIVEEHIKNGEEPVVLASHSNARKICNRDRNLTDEQIIRLKNAGGYLGLFSNGNFVSLDNEELSKEKRKEKFLNMVSYVVDELDYPKDKILLATDDMNFNPDISYHGLETFDIFNLKEEVQKTLLTKFDEASVNMFMIKNFETLYNKLNKINYYDPENNSPSWNMDAVNLSNNTSISNI